jgi:hypothetical protein
MTYRVCVGEQEVVSTEEWYGAYAVLVDELERRRSHLEACLERTLAALEDAHALANGEAFLAVIDGKLYTLDE